MRGHDLTREQRRELVAKAEERAGIRSKEIDLAGAFYEGGGEIGIAPAYFDMPGAVGEERDRRVAKVKKAGRGNSATFALLEAFARAYKAATLHVWRGPWMDLERAERLDNHPATRSLGLLRRPNPAAHMTMSQLQPAIAKGKLAAGDFYLVKARTGGGTVLDNTTGAVARLWPVWATRMQPAVYTKADGIASSGWIDYYAYHVGKGKPLQIPVKNVIHFKNGMRDDEPRLGIGVVEEFSLEVGSDIEAALLLSAVMSNLGVPGLVFSPEPGGGGAAGGALGGGLPSIPSEDRAEIKSMITAKTTGKRRGEAIVLSRPTKFEQFRIDLEQYDLGHIWEHVETRMSGVVGWPAILAGLQAGLDAATYANVASLRRFATENATVPTWQDDSETWTLALGPDLGLRDDEFIAYDYRSVPALQEDRDALWKRVGEEWARGALTIGQHHRLLGLELPPGVEPNLRKPEIEASAQLSGLLRPALGKAKSFIIDGTVVRETPLKLDMPADAPAPGRKALPLPATVTIDEGDIDAAEREWDKWAEKFAPELVGIMGATVEEGDAEEDDGDE